MFFWALGALGLGWIFTRVAGGTTTSEESRGSVDLEAKHDAAAATGEKTSNLVASLDVLPPPVKARAIAAVVKADPALMRASADEIEALGYHDLAARLRLRASVLS